MNPLQQISKQINSNPVLAFLLVAWLVTWKGFALWKAAKKDQKPWFAAILILNTLGLLEIIYLFVVPKLEKKFPKKQK